MQMRDAVRGDSFVGVFKRVLAKEGVTGLYRGILPEFAKVAPGVAITGQTSSGLAAFLTCSRKVSHSDRGL